jgi:pimeloyl-ACP methyl ester carboxylesterase
MREERFETDGVPARLYDPGDGRGVLLLGHGASQSKDDELYLALGRQYASETGLAVVCIDALNHGERAGDLTAQWQADAAETMVSDWQKTAASVSSLGEPVAYVGFSMGMIFGAPTVAAMPSIKAAVFGVGGVPSAGGVEDPAMRARMLAVAASLAHPQVLMVNMTQDEIFSTEGTHAFFDAIPGRKKRLMFWEGAHSALPSEAVRHSVAFINRYTAV